MKKIENKAMLITYADTLGGDLKQLDRVLDQYFPDAFGGVHVLPFFPSSGDRGFAVIHYDTVAPEFGTWEDIDRLGSRYYLMADFMLNHVSIRSEEFRDYMEKGDASAYKDMFIHWDTFWPNGEPTEAELSALYRRKDGGPYLTFTRKDGKQVRLWNTFFGEQIDIDPYAKPTQEYYRRNLSRLASHVPLVRFDAFAYASKEPGTSCFFVEPKIWEVLEIGMKPLREAGAEMLPEIHENYTIQQKMAEKGYWVYDFALPMLLLHGLHFGRTDRLIHWLNICPRKQFTTLDTHDGIGLVDVAGLLTEEEIDATQELVDRLTADVKPYIPFPTVVRVPGKPVQRYQMMTTYYSALGCDDRAYLLARAVQFFAPGTPQVYYVGLLAGENDIEGVKNDTDPRTVNRHSFTEPEIRAAAQKPVVQQLLELLRFRNSCPAFNGTIEIDQDGSNGMLHITWRNGDCAATLDADFKDKCFRITERKGDTVTERFRQES
ncbi:MAG TPA: sucrose phosphorylase [Candidatus Gemmiger excrementigallinarum]|uniref:Sucrose 6(F)-phosphate phosphorylase n=1 Tax=Candidatus Gemmiger excrementigallinarum TaxID=2838609 RepID=A0A9D2EQQ2_9FIRM|nr:sucrose phosphorylase [Candidatus Gemmiger excrementigallinarum]